MIQASELRVNNSVISHKHNGLITEIHSIMPSGVKLWANPLAPCYKFDEISGIPLTEELLLKMGFSAIGTSGNTEYFSLDEWDIDFYEGEWHVNLAAQSLTSIKYVHQLMNLFHALTGQELTLS